MSAIEEKLVVSANHLFLHIFLLLFPTSTKFLDETKAQCPLCSEDKYGDGNRHENQLETLVGR